MADKYRTTVYEPTDNRNHIALRLLDRPIAYHRIFVDLTGSVTAAVMLSQAFYWSRRTKDKAGWFYKSHAEWTEETGLSRKEQSTARAKLREFDWWQEDKRKANGAPTIHYRINLNAFYRDLTSIATSSGSLSDGHNGMCEIGQSNAQNGTFLECAESDNPINIEYTEIRAEKHTPLAQPQRRRQTPEHMRAASLHGLEPRDMTRLVNAVLDATGKRALADTDGVLGDRELSYAQECAVTLLQLGVHSPEAVADTLKAFRDEYPKYGDPSYRQLCEVAGKRQTKAQTPRIPSNATRNADGSVTVHFVPKLEYAA